MRVFALELRAACRIHPVPLEIKLRLERLRLVELIRSLREPSNPTAAARGRAYAPELTAA
jgi:hypothetical protein